MKKIFSILCAMVLVLSASAAPVKMAKAHKAQLPAIEKSINHNRMVPVKVATTNIKKAPAIVNNGQILADYSQAYYIDASLTSAASLWEFDFYNGNDFSAYVMVEAIDGKHIAGTYTLDDGEVIVAVGDTTVITSGSMSITYDVPSTSYLISLSATCANGQTYTLNHSFVYNSDLYALDYELVMYLEAGFGSLVGVSSYSDCLIALKDTPVVATDTIAVTFNPYYDEEGEGGWDDNVATKGWWQYQGETADQSLYVTISPTYTDHVAGTYDNSEMDIEYTYIYDEIANKAYEFVTLTVVVTENNGVVTVTAEGLCENSIYYIMTCNTTVPTAVENVEAGVKAKKYIQNGQVFIEKNGVKYNAAGVKF